MTHFNNYQEYLAHWVFRAIRDTALRTTRGRCAHCGAPATEVHHLRYPKPWGAFDTPDNLQPICHDCHCRIEGKAA
jgi:5-methylcytosine-specific restriction endonuclease McrA